MTLWLRRRLADHFIIRATRHPIEDAEPATQSFVPVPQGRVDCYALRKPAGGKTAPLDLSAEPADLLILKLPGTAGRAERSTSFPASLLPSLDVEVWTWNPPGYGQSDGSAKLTQIPNAVLSLWDHLRQCRVGPRTKTLVIGNSLGSVTALHLGRHREPDALFLKNPPPLIQMVSAGNAWWNGFRGGTWIAGAVPPEMDATESAALCNVRALFVQSELDRLVTPRMQHFIVDAYAGEHRVHVLPGADHDSPYEESDLPGISEQLQWLLT